MTGNIRYLFLPPNVSLLFQPMDHGLQKIYQKKYLDKVLGILEDDLVKGS